MNRFACIRFQKRRIRTTVSLYSPIFGGGDNIFVGVEVQWKRRCGGIDSGCHRRRRRSTGGRTASTIIGPRSGDDLCDTDVAAIATSLGAELTVEVWRETEDGGRDAVKCGGDAGSREMTAAKVVEGRKGCEIGIGTTLKGKNAVKTRNGHIRRRFTLELNVLLCSLLLHLLPLYQPNESPLPFGLGSILIYYCVFFFLRSSTLVYFFCIYIRLLDFFFWPIDY